MENPAEKIIIVVSPESHCCIAVAFMNNEAKACLIVYYINTPEATSK